MPEPTVTQGSKSNTFDGGPAFPQVETQPETSRNWDDTIQIYGNTYSTGGMSLHTYIAVQAMKALLSNSGFAGKATSWISQEAVYQANSMMDKLFPR